MDVTAVAALKDLGMQSWSTATKERRVSKRSETQLHKPLVCWTCSVKTTQECSEPKLCLGVRVTQRIIAFLVVEGQYVAPIEPLGLWHGDVIMAVRVSERVTGCMVHRDTLPRVHGRRLWAASDQ